MGAVTVQLKIPQDGEWVALTEINADGEWRPLGYVDSQILLRLIDEARPLADLLANYRKDF